MPTTTTKQKKTQVEIPGETTAKVTERRGPSGEIISKTVNYDAKVTDQEISDNTDDLDIEDLTNFGADDNDILGVDIETLRQQEPRKTALELMFASINMAISQGQPDQFYAMVMRTPDPIGTNYKIRCSDNTDIGTFQFSSRDLFNFKNELQRLNGNSGGVFSLSIYDRNQQQLKVTKQGRNGYNTYTFDVGLQHFTVNDPPLEINNQSSDNNQHQGNNSLIVEMIKDNQAFQAKLFERLNAPVEKSFFEKALEQKMANDLLNPQPQVNQMEQMMTTLIGLPIFMERLTNRIMPEAVASATEQPPTGADMVLKYLNNPTITSVLERVGDILETAALSKLQLPANTEDGTAPSPDGNASPMQQLMAKIIAELETDNVIDPENATVIELSSTYPQYIAQIETMCQSMPFEAVMSYVTTSLAKITPSPLLPFIMQNEQGQKVFNERGVRLQTRLQEFYHFVRGEMIVNVVEPEV